MAVGYDISLAGSSAAKSGNIGGFSLTGGGGSTIEPGGKGCSNIPWLVLGIVAALVVVYMFWRRK